TNTAWTSAEQNALTDYLRRGGSLFVASMEILTRVGEAGGPSARLGLLHVQTFVEDNNPDPSDPLADLDVPDATGAHNDPVGQGIINVALDYSAYEDPSGLKEFFVPD